MKPMVEVRGHDISSDLVISSVIPSLSIATMTPILMDTWPKSLPDIKLPIIASFDTESDRS